MPVNTNVATRWEEPAKAVYLIDPDTGLPVGSQGTPLETRQPCWSYVGGIAMTLDGTNDQQVALPGGTTAFYLRARGGEVYYNVNGLSCSATDPGYVPEDGSDGTGKVSNLTSLWIFSATASTVAHLQFFSGG